MDVTKLIQLQKASATKSYDPDRDVQWDVPFPAGIPSILPDEVLSLFGTQEFESLSEQEKGSLALHETAAMFSAFIRFEGVLNQALARMVRAGDPLSETTVYRLKIIEEEARHSRMFSRLVAQLGVGAYRPQGIHGAAERAGEWAVAKGHALYFLGMLAVEEITDIYIARVLAGGAKHPTLRDVCKIHRVEEARHMEYARMDLADAYRGSSFVARKLIQVAAPIVLLFVFESMNPPLVYLRSGVASSESEAWRLWRSSRRSHHHRKFFQDCTSRILPFLVDLRMVSRSSLPLWKAIGLDPK